MAGPEDAIGRDPDPFSHDRLERMLAAAGLAGSLVDASPIGRASDVVYVLTVESDADERRIVLKHPDLVGDERFRREVRLQAFVGERTSIPVPDVLAIVDRHDAVPSPFFVMEYVRGADPETVPSDPGRDGRLRMARACGRNLAELHDLGPLSGFGWIDVDDGELTVVDPTASWPDALRERVASALDGLHEGRFADLQSDLRTHLERELDRLSDDLADREPVPIHDDYRPGNLLVDPDTWETLAVLDWGAAGAATREHELAKCEQFFCGWAPLDAELRRQVRDALYEGYEERYELERDEGSERRRELSLLVTRIGAMYWLPYWYEGASEAERDRAAAEHRAFVSELID